MSHINFESSSGSTLRLRTQAGTQGWAPIGLGDLDGDLEYDLEQDLDLLIELDRESLLTGVGGPEMCILRGGDLTLSPSKGDLWDLEDDLLLEGDLL